MKTLIYSTKTKSFDTKNRDVFIIYFIENRGHHNHVIEHYEYYDSELHKNKSDAIKSTKEIYPDAHNIKAFLYPTELKESQEYRFELEKKCKR